MEFVQDPRNLAEACAWFKLGLFALSLYNRPLFSFGKNLDLKCPWIRLELYRLGTVC